MDSVTEGVGVSQVLPYVERLGERGVRVTLHSFEAQHAPLALRDRFASAGVTWHPHRFRSGGSIAGLQRVAVGALHLRGAELVHARTELAAASALLARSDAWVWDMRSFWREERIEQGLLRPGSPEDRVVRSIERASARRSGAIVTLADAAIPVLAERDGGDVIRKAQAITTCVDLERFACAPMPSTARVSVLLAGTLNSLYDVPRMLTFIRRMRASQNVDLHVLSPSPGPWQATLEQAGAHFGSARSSEMPALLTRHHVGMSLRRPGSSTVAAMPIKIGEFLATGRPVVVNTRLGDMDQLLDRYDCGVVVGDESDETLDAGVVRLERLLSDPNTPARCRALAEAHFDLDIGVDHLLATYRTALQARVTR